MLIPIAVVVVLVQIIAKSHNYNIKTAKNPDFDIRVKRDLDYDNLKRNKNEIISEIFENIDNDQAIEILDVLDNILDKKIVISKPIETPNDNVEKTSKITHELVDIDVDEFRQFIEDITKIRNEEKSKGTLVNQNVKVNRNTDDIHGNVSSDFDKTTTETIDDNFETNDVELETILKDNNVISETKAISDSNRTAEIQNKNLDIDNNIRQEKIRLFVENTIKLINNLNQENIIIKDLLQTNDEYETERTDYDKTTNQSMDDNYEITKFISKLSDTVKDLKLIATSNSKREFSKKNKDNNKQRNNLSIIDIITKDRLKRNASPDGAFMNFINNIYNKLYNVTHTDNKKNIENDELSNNLNVNSNYNQLNDLYNQKNINNDNYIINNQAYQYYNNFNQFNGTDYNQNRLYYNRYKYPINVTYNNIYNNAYRKYPYNYGYLNNQYNINNSSINNNHLINNNSDIDYNLTDVKDINEFNDESTEPTIIQGCILCSYIGCPIHYKRVGYMCIKNRG